MLLHERVSSSDVHPAGFDDHRSFPAILQKLAIPIKFRMKPAVNLFYNGRYNMTRGRPRAFDKAQALDTALRLFWRYGYEGTSIAALAQQIGVTVPSLYLAFGNKESLFMQAVEHYGCYSGALYTEVLAKPSAREVALGILEGEVELVAGGETPEGCLMVQGALATSPDAEEIRARLAGLRRNAQSHVAERFERARLEGDLPEGWEPQALASYIMTVASGMAVQAKSGASRQELLDVVETAMLIWPPQVGESRSGRRIRTARSRASGE